jgi:hypothetical protein
MCPAAILGDRASGKTTFLGALYAAQVKYGTGIDDDFRFFAPPDSVRFMSSIYESMLSGAFPGATLKDQLTRVEFTFGYRTLIGRLARNTESRILKPWKGIRFAAYDVSGEDVQEYIESGVASSSVVKELLVSRVVVILVDCSKMNLDHKSTPYRHMLRYDSDVTKLVSNFATYKLQEFEHQKAAKRDSAPPVIYPAIILTKTDLIRPEVFHQLGLPNEVPQEYKSKARREFCEGLLRVFLPQTLAQLRGGKVAGVSFDRAQYFASWVRTVTSDGGMTPAGKPSIRVLPAAAGRAAAMDYSYDEYVAFIEYFRQIAGKVADAEADEAGSLGAT